MKESLTTVARPGTEFYVPTTIRELVAEITGFAHLTDSPREKLKGKKKKGKPAAIENIPKHGFPRKVVKVGKLGSLFR